MAYKKFTKTIFGNQLVHYFDNDDVLFYGKEYFHKTRGGGLKFETYYINFEISFETCYYKNGNLKSIRNHKNDDLNYLPSYVSFYDSNNHNICVQQYYFNSVDGGGYDEIVSLIKQKKDEEFENGGF